MTVLYLKLPLTTKYFTTWKSWAKFMNNLFLIDKNIVLVSRFKKLNCQIVLVVVVMVKISIKIIINCCLLSGQENKMTVCMQMLLYIKINSIDMFLNWTTHRNKEQYRLVFRTISIRRISKYAYYKCIQNRGE